MPFPTFSVLTDWKPPARVRDTEAMRRRHLRGGGCELAVEDPRACDGPVSIHHLISRQQGGDDVDGNFVLLCGHGTRGHHGLIENEDQEARAALGRHLIGNRPDAIQYLRGKLGWDAAEEWLARRLFV